MFKKLFAYILMMAILCMMFIPVNADSATFDNDEDNHLDQFQTVCIAPENFFPFIYSNHVDWAQWREYIGECDCEEGYLYVKNLETGVIIQILPQPVLQFLETLPYLYCLTEDSQIIRVDYSGLNAEVIYDATTEQLSNLAYYAGVLYFNDGINIVKLELANMEASIVAAGHDVVEIFAYDVDQLLLTYENGDRYTFDISSNVFTLISCEHELQGILFSSLEVADLNTYSTYGVYALGSSDASVLPLPEYEVGSYFTDNGEACGENHHDSSTCLPNYYDDTACSCKLYAASSQCMGFARYASDQYAHLSYNSSSGWTVQRGICAKQYEESSTDILGNPSDVRAIFQNLTAGAYVRLEYSGGGHSFVIVNHNDSDGDGVYDGVTTYDCNVDGQCGISLNYRSYESIAYHYRYVYNTVSHNFSGVVARYSSSCHSVKCTGCNGYALRLHYAVSSNRNTCVECGYVGSMQVIVG